MSLAANDLPIRSTATTPTTQSTLDPFDYASARLDLNDARERKLRADDLLHKYASSFTKSSFKYSKNNTSSSAAITTTHEALARDQDHRLRRGRERPLGAARGRPQAHLVPEQHRHWSVPMLKHYHSGLSLSSKDASLTVFFF